MPVKGVRIDRCYSSRLNPTRRVLSRGGVLQNTVRCFTHLSHDIHRAQALATTQCTSWRFDGSPSCLGGSSHGWVSVNTHSAPVPGTPGRLWVAHWQRALHRHMTSPRPKFFQQTTAPRRCSGVRGWTWGCVDELQKPLQCSCE